MYDGKALMLQVCNRSVHDEQGRGLISKPWAQVLLTTNLATLYAVQQVCSAEHDFLAHILSWLSSAVSPCCLHVMSTKSMQWYTKTRCFGTSASLAVARGRLSWCDTTPLHCRSGKQLVASMQPTTH
jgi:hypothetical protein